MSCQTILLVGDDVYQITPSCCSVDAGVFAGGHGIMFAMGRECARVSNVCWWRGILPGTQQACVAASYVTDEGWLHVRHDSSNCADSTSCVLQHMQFCCGWTLRNSSIVGDDVYQITPSCSNVDAGVFVDGHANMFAMGRECARVSNVFWWRGTLPEAQQAYVAVSDVTDVAWLHVRRDSSNRGDQVESCVFQHKQ